MNTTYIIIIASISILVILAITSIRKKAKLRDEFIDTFDFNNNDFVVRKEKKEYERQGKIGTEFIWVNKNNSGYLTITIGLNFILKDRYKNLGMLEYLKFSNKFLKKYKKEDYQILGQNNTILIKEVEVKNKAQIPTVNRIDNILADLSKVIGIEKLKA